MVKNEKSVESKDYKERFEFELTVGGNIICQRYFRILGFNPQSLKSYNLTDAVRHCVATIDNDLKDKTQAYLEYYAPQIFNSMEEMNEFVSNPENKDRLRTGLGLVVRGNDKTDYAYTQEGTIKELGYKFDDGELTLPLDENGKTTYRFAFKVDGREACVMEWDGWYPKFVRDKNRIDLSNKRGKYEGEDVSRLSFEQYLLYKMVEGKSDLVYGLIKTLCQACSSHNGQEFITETEDILESWKQTNTALLWHVY